MISLFYIAYLVSVTSLPIKLLPERKVNQSLVGLRSSLAGVSGRLPHYWLSGSNVRSVDLETTTVCGDDGMPAMPKNAAEIDAITAMLANAENAATFGGHDDTWNGKFAWLGGKKVDGDTATFKWFDKTVVSVENWDKSDPDHLEPGTSGSSGSLAYQPFMGLVRKHSLSNVGKWHDFHGQDQGSNGQEASTGQPVVCQERYHYWVSTAGVTSNALRPVSTDICVGGEMAMPKLEKEQERLQDVILAKLPTVGGLAWSGTYLWLGGYMENDVWAWNDGTPVETGNWDTNEPGTSASGTDQSSMNYQPYLGLKRANGKFHDFHGQDQGVDGKEATVGQLALCQGYPEYWTVGPVPSSDLDTSSGTFTDPCGAGGRIAQNVCLGEESTWGGSSFPRGGAWGGSFLWLGGTCETNKNCVWFDGTPIPLGDNWDTNEPGTSNSDPQPFVGMKRSTGKWHDFHGRNSEDNPGQYALCQAS